MSFVIELRQGATLIASRTPSLTTTLATYEYTLTAPERALITDWTLLRFHFIGNTDQTQVSWAEFAVPGSGAYGDADGTSTATATSAAILGLQSAVGSAAGVAVAIGGELFRGDAAGSATSLGIGASTTVADGLSVGTSAGFAFSVEGSVAAAIGESAGLAVVTGAMELTATQGLNSFVGSAAGAAVVLGNALTGNILTINDVEYTYKRDACTIQESYQGVNTLQVTIWYSSLPYEVPFTRGDEIIITEDGTVIFGGYIDTVESSGIGGEVPNSVEYLVSASDYKTLADFRNVVAGGFPAGFTLQNAFLSTGGYLQIYGVTFDSDGPTVLLPELHYDVRSIRAIWDEFADLTGYIWTIDYYKHATISLPGSISAPFNVGFSSAAFIGPVYRYFIQQAEYYHYLHEGDARLATWLSGSTLTAYDAIMDSLDGYHASIIANMAPEERAAFDAAFLFAFENEGFLAEDINFLIQQAEYYNYLPENDPRFKTWFSGTTITAYELGIAGIAASLNGVLNAMDPAEWAAMVAAYTTATAAGVLGTTDHLGDVTVMPSEIEYANHVIVRFGEGAKEIEDDLGGLTDGVQTAFPLTYSSLIAHRGYVQLNGVYETFSIGGGGTWDYDPTTNIITRLSAPLAGSTILFTYTSQFPQVVTATAFGEIENHPIKEVVLAYPDIFSYTTAQAVANAWLPRYVAMPRSAKYRTRRAGIHPGMLQTVQVPSRHFDHTCFVSSVTITSTEYGFVRDVEVLQGALLQGSWRDLYRIWGSGGGGGGSSVSGGIVLTTPGPSSGGTVRGSGTVDSLSKWLTITTIGDAGLSSDALGALTSGSTGAGFTIALSVSTVTGTLADARLTSNVPLKDVPNAFVATSPSSFRSTTIATDALRIDGAPGDEWATIGFWDSLGTTEYGYITGRPFSSMGVGAVSHLTLETTSGSLYLSPAGDLLLDPTSNYVLPISGYDINLGRLNRKYLTLHAAELWVETLVAQDTIATIGGRILVGPTTTLTADIDSVVTTILVKHNQMVVGDIVYMEANGSVEFMEIVSGPTGTGPYSYEVTRNLDGSGGGGGSGLRGLLLLYGSFDESGGNAWTAGDAIFNTGQTGNGFIDIYSIRGVRSGTEIGPAIVGNVRTSATFNAWEPRWAIGNLNGTFGYTTDVYGVAFGDWQGTAVTIDADYGFWIGYNGDDRFYADTSGNLTLAGDLTVGTAGIIRTAGATALTTGTGIYMAGGTTPVFRVGVPAGNQIKWDGTDLTVLAATVMIDASGISLPAGNATQSANYAYRFTSTQAGTNVTGLFAYETNSTSRRVDVWCGTSTAARNSSISVLAATGDASAYLLCDVTSGGVSTITISCVTAFASCNFVPLLDNTYTLGVTGARWTAVWATNGTIQTSDQRLKRDILPDDALGLAFVNQLQTKGFRYLDDEVYRIGFIAQEVQDALAGRPFAGLYVSPDHLGLNYAAFVPVLTTAIQELDRRLSALEAK